MVNAIRNNISAEPEFVYDWQHGNLRLLSTSACIDSGDNTCIDIGDTDWFGNDRIYDTNVDIGAIEAHCDATSNDYDINHDGNVNYWDYSIFANAWGYYDPNDINTDPNDPTENWNSQCNFDDSDNVIDSDDLALLIDQWLWKACYWQSDYDTINIMPMQAMGMMMVLPPSEQEQLEAEITNLATSLTLLQQLSTSAEDEDEIQQAQQSLEDMLGYLINYYNETYE